MITSEITEEDFLFHLRRYDARVATLDGVPIEDGIASCDYDLQERCGFHVNYQIEGKYYVTFVVLRRPDGELVKSFSDNFDKTLVYAAERPGKYPDDQETYQRFVQGRQTLTVKGNRRKLPKDIRILLQGETFIKSLYRYHHDLYMLDDGTEHGDRYKCHDRNYQGEESYYYSGTLEEAEEFLFDMFMLYGHTF